MIVNNYIILGGLPMNNYIILAGSSKNDVFHYETEKASRDYDLTLFNPNRERLSYSNGKTGFISWSLLAGSKDSSYNGLIPGAIKKAGLVCRGSCPCNCEGCYAKKMTRLPDVYIKTYLNTLEALLDPDKFLELVFNEITRNCENELFIRIHDQGDFISYKYYCKVMDYCKNHSKWNYGIYTKCESYVYKYGIANIPSNVVISCSPWAGHCEPIGDLPQFIYDDHSNPELATLPHCPAVNKDGKRTGITCRQCMHCYTARHGDRWAVYSH